MGLYDRDYVRDDDERRGFHLALPRTVVGRLMLGLIALYLVDVLFFTDQEERYGLNLLSDKLSLHGDLLQKPWQAWQLLTYWLFHDPKDLFHLLFNLLGLWTFGRMVERDYGGRRFFLLTLTLAVVSGIPWAIVEGLTSTAPFPRQCLGISGAVTGLIVTVCLRRPNEPISIIGLPAVPAWIIGAIIVGIDLVNFNASIHGEGRNVAYLVHLSGAAAAAVLHFANVRFDWKFRNPLAARRQLRIYREKVADEELEARVDELLEKIHRSGEASLTAEERRTLKQASERLQQQRRRG